MYLATVMNRRSRMVLSSNYPIPLDTVFCVEAPAEALDRFARPYVWGIDISIPLSAIFLGVMVQGEQLDWIAFVAKGLISIGIAAIDDRLIKMFK